MPGKASRIPLNFPVYDFLIREAGEREEIWDPARKRYVNCSPEEWVRQHALRYLSEVLRIPLSLIAVEYSLSFNRMDKRCDILVFSKTGKPVMMVECKASHVKLQQKVFEQLARYNMVFQVPYLWITNGLEHYSCSVNHESGEIRILEALPGWETLNA